MNISWSPLTPYPIVSTEHDPDCKVHGANMGPAWVQNQNKKASIVYESIFIKLLYIYEYCGNGA